LALYYLETSALVKLYVREAGTDLLLRLVARGNDHRFAVLALARIEFRSAIRRREREGDIESGIAGQLLDRLDQHLEATFECQGVGDSVIDVACSLVDRYPLRAYDAVQLAGCLALKTSSTGDDPTFVCSDRRLIEAAQAEGLAVMDPSAP
jgi:predicted nucleic acid-binding protein